MIKRYQKGKTVIPLESNGVLMTELQWHVSHAEQKSNK